MLINILLILYFPQVGIKSSTLASVCKAVAKDVGAHTAVLMIYFIFVHIHSPLFYFDRGIDFVFPNGELILGVALVDSLLSQFARGVVANDLGAPIGLIEIRNSVNLHFIISFLFGFCSCSSELDSYRLTP
jgi:hypothetical protein